MSRREAAVPPCPRCSSDVELAEVRVTVGDLYSWRWERCASCAQSVALAAARYSRRPCTHPGLPPIHVRVTAGDLFTWQWQRCLECAHAVGVAAAVQAGLNEAKVEPAAD